MRSLLFVPGDQESKLDKALSAGADALVLDLEDSVVTEAKPRAREIVARFLSSTRGREHAPRLYVRINDLAGAHWTRDLPAVMPAPPDGLMLPKPRSGEDVRLLAKALDEAERRAGLPEGSTRIIAIATETPSALFDMASFSGASPRLEGLAWGREDLSAAVGATDTRDASGALTSPFRLARDLTLFAAAAAGVAAFDEVHVDFRDLDGLARAAREAARDGFSGKMAIHPDQVALINAAFTPTAEEIEEAREIVGLFAQAGERGVVAHEGRMLDRPHLTRAERLLARARLAGVEGV
jgi:citrate lyase subunit beta/citryl-CoA lyase